VIGKPSFLHLILPVLAVGAGFAVTAHAPALAQQRPPARQAPKPAEKEPPPPPPEQAAPYDRDLTRLSEIIGSLAFLRELCAGADAAEWPNRMKALIEAEGVTPGRRDRLAGAYNRGYRGYASTYRVCTPAAHEAAGRFVAEGERLSHALAGRFGG
jgi:uncharacterized protein (TIGR02301 family)